MSKLSWADVINKINLSETETERKRRLIYNAAPEMYRALQEILCIVDDIENFYPNLDIECERIRELANTALRKTEGN